MALRSAEPGHQWLGFGFGAFGQLQCGEPLPPVCWAPDPGGGGGAAAGSSPPQLTQLSPAWSHTGALTGDGHLVLCGFLGGRPQQYVSLPSRGCLDLLMAEKYLLLMFKDCVECWNTDELCSGGLHGDPIWKMDIPTDEKKAFPLVSDGYVMPKPPFFKKLPCAIQVHKLVLGNEHALLLSCDWEVFTWGSGRHGQLGHGGLEDVSEPLIVEALRGMSMSDVAAGGWHSVSISEAGDIYIWGWNESGQLGLPSKSLAGQRKGTSRLQQKDSVQGKQELASKREEGNISTVQEADKESNSDQKTFSIEKSLGSVGEDCGHASEFISIQAFPALLDLPEESEVIKVSCGSRHTAVVTREGYLYTWGWGTYGQLGHGDANSLDQPQLVECLSQKQLCVKDVVCGLWNTFVLCVHKTDGL